ncbi:ATP-binding protein [Paenibacillus tarimensis]|uniref:ATP-binding protein n=2 Tax=Paenibacillus tarimensis TaxID=416012 RepID=UPI001F1D3564|nr:ATP-binding protein [Paenibacillus tarimensis]MCF2945017.1 ATP-binding protein [Paenibacillus tarimensis]
MFHFISHYKSGMRERHYGMIGGAAVFGFGLSSMHFVGMLTWDYMISFGWHLGLIFVLGAGFAYLAYIRLGGTGSLRRIMASLYVSAGALAIHYVNMISGPISRFHMDLGLFLMSVLLILAGSWGAFYRFDRKEGNFKLVSAILLGSSVAGMILIGMEAVTIEYRDILTADKLNDMMMLLVIIIGFETLFVPLGSLAAWFMNRRFNVVDERYKLLVENSMDMIAIMRDGRWEYVNKAGLQMFEAKREEEMINRSVFDFLHPAYHEQLREQLVNLNGDYDNSRAPEEQEWYTVTGKLLYTEVVKTLTSFGDKPAIQVIVRDISERKKNEELLINSEKLYVAGQLAAGIAHEIRNPLTSLKGFLQLMASGRAANSQYFDIMKSELTRIESIVSEMLMLSKPQIYELAVKDIRTILNDTVILLEAQALMHGIMLELKQHGSPLWVNGVENQIKQVFINIMKNAIEAMPDGGTISVTCFGEDDTVIVRIVDEGPGIAGDQLQKMGQPFYTTKDKGTGLGLMVSYKIVDNHKGKIRVDSRLGTGTTMDIIFPLADRDAAAGEAEAPGGEQKNHSFAG